MVQWLYDLFWFASQVFPYVAILITFKLKSNHCDGCCPKKEKEQQR